jgi:hypothetical protein
MKRSIALLRTTGLALMPVLMIACVTLAVMPISPPPGPDSIVGEWDLVHFLVDGGASSPGYRLHQWLVFTSGGRLVYDDGCNWHYGQYSLDGSGSLSASMPQSTLVACGRCERGWADCERIPPEGWSVPSWLEAAPWEIHGNLLRLCFAEDRSRGAVFRWKGPAQGEYSHGDMLRRAMIRLERTRSEP